MNDVFSNSPPVDKPILGRMSGDTTTALLSSRFSREQRHIASFVSSSASIARISQQINRKRDWQDQFKTIVQLARAGSSNGRGLANPMYAFERALMDLWALYEQCIAFRLPTLEMLLWVSLYLQRLDKHIDDAGPAQMQHMFGDIGPLLEYKDANIWRNSDSMLTCLRSYNELLGRISVDPTARFITSHAAVSDSLWDPVLEARGLIRSISHAGDVHPYVAGVRLERMYWSRVSEDVSEQTARSQEVRGNMASMAKAIKAIEDSGHCLETFADSARAEARKLKQDLDILRVKGRGSTRLSRRGKAAMELWSFIEGGNLYVSRVHVIGHLEARLRYCEAERDHLDQLKQCRDMIRYDPPIRRAAPSSALSTAKSSVRSGSTGLPVSASSSSVMSRSNSAGGSRASYNSDTSTLIGSSRSPTASRTTAANSASLPARCTVPCGPSGSTSSRASLISSSSTLVDSANIEPEPTLSAKGSHRYQQRHKSATVFLPTLQEMKEKPLPPLPACTCERDHAVSTDERVVMVTVVRYYR